MAQTIGGIQQALTRLGRRGAFGIATATLAVLACYGVLALTVLLPLVGMRLVVDESLWSGTIVLFTSLTTMALVAGIRAHGAWMPAAAGALGASLIIHALWVDYRAVAEFAGFVLLAAAVARDVVLHRRLRRA